MERFSQQDPRWSENVLGDGDETIGSAGCLLCCLAMACQAYGFDETPGTLNQKMTRIGGFDGSLIITYLIARAVPGMKIINFVNCPDDPAPIAEIDAALAAGQVVIALVDYDPNKAGIQHHYVVLEKMLAGGDYAILDPWPLKETVPGPTLLGRFGKGKTAAEAIYGVFLVGGPIGKIVPTAAPVEVADGGMVEVVSDQVNLRLRPGRAEKDIGDLTLGDRIETTGRVEEVDGLRWVEVKAWAAESDGEEFLRRV